MFCLFFAYGLWGGEKFKATTTLKQFQASNREQNDKSVENHPVVLAPLTVEEEGNIGDYLLGPGDLIDIKVFEAEELNAVVRVSSSGVVNVPLLGDVSVINLTAAEAEQEIEKLYKKDYLYDPHVSLYIRPWITAPCGRG